MIVYESFYGITILDFIFAYIDKHPLSSIHILEN